MATALGIPESTISKAKTEKLKHETPDTRALHSYLARILERRQLPITVTEAAFGYLAAGGREAELVELMVLATRLVRSREIGPRVPHPLDCA